jgi:REP element-mobilizing transposase RayT
MSTYLHKRHNVTVLIYHIVCPSKYRRIVFLPEVSNTLKQTCLEIGLRYNIEFLEIGTDKDHVHFLVQLPPTNSINKTVQTIKSITAREIFSKHPEVKKKLWGGQFWSDGFFANTVSKSGNEKTITQYVKDQGIENDYEKLHAHQPSLF